MIYAPMAATINLVFMLNREQLLDLKKMELIVIEIF